jgi:hypothetical protein
LLKILLSLLFIAPAALAQEVDLRTLPVNYSFVSIETDALVTVRYLRPDGDEFIFETVIDYYDKPSETALLRVNRASQTTFWSVGGDTARYSPHDCAPALGTCYFSFPEDGETVKVKTVTRLIGDIHMKDEFSWGGDEWLFWNRECVVYDKYGFWVDYVRTYWDGTLDEGYRQQEAPNRIDELWRMCDPAAAVS